MNSVWAVRSKHAGGTTLGSNLLDVPEVRRLVSCTLSFKNGHILSFIHPTKVCGHPSRARCWDTVVCKTKRAS